MTSVDRMQTTNICKTVCSPNKTSLVWMQCSISTCKIKDEMDNCDSDVSHWSSPVVLSTDCDPLRSSSYTIHWRCCFEGQVCLSAPTLVVIMAMMASFLSPKLSVCPSFCLSVCLGVCLSLRYSMPFSTCISVNPLSLFTPWFNF